jgi:hypothetical protein
MIITITLPIICSWLARAFGYACLFDSRANMARGLLSLLMFQRAPALCFQRFTAGPTPRPTPNPHTRPPLKPRRT